MECCAKHEYMSTQEPVKRRYQIFRKLANKLSFDDIESDIQELSTPCSEVVELTDEEFRLFDEERRTSYDSKFCNIRIVPLDTWFTPAEIKAVIEVQKAKKEAAAKKLADAQAKKEARKQRFAAHSALVQDNKDEKFAKKVAKVREYANQCSMSRNGLDLNLGRNDKR